jgi:hypothetical protein
MKYEREIISKKIVVAWVEVLSGNLPGGGWRKEINIEVTHELALFNT